MSKTKKEEIEDAIGEAIKAAAGHKDGKAKLETSQHAAEESDGRKPDIDGKKLKDDWTRAENSEKQKGEGKAGGPKHDGKHEKSSNEAIAELTELVKRTQADFINYKNRVERDNKELCSYFNAEFVKKLLPVLDSFDNALKTDDGDLRKGLEMIYMQMKGILKQEGLKDIECVGQKFDPYRHEVILKEKSDKAEGTILEEFQKGYMYKERIVRHSKVKIAG